MENRFALHADRIFDGERLLKEQTVLVEDGTISSFPVEPGPDVPVVTFPGCTVIPGLIDAHIHFMRWQGPLFLAFGVTTVRDVGNVLEWILERRAEWQRHPWPRILCAGPMIDGPTPFWKTARANADAGAAARTVREIAAAGVDLIKLYSCMPDDWLPPVVTAAHEAGLRAAMHCQTANAVLAGEYGVDESFHLDGLMDEIWPGGPQGWIERWGDPGIEKTLDRQKKVADRIARSGMTVTPTLSVFDGEWKIASPGHPLPEESVLKPEAVVEWETANFPRKDPEGARIWRAALRAAQRFTGYLLDRGVRVLSGTDAPFMYMTPGLSLWQEMRLLVESGMSPEQALGAATSESAQFIGAERIGRIAPGYQADMAIVKGDVTKNIPEKPGIPAVVRSGQLFHQEDLIEASNSYISGFSEELWTKEMVRVFQRR